MTNSKYIHYRNHVCLKIVFCIFILGFGYSCASLGKNYDDAILHVTPLIDEEPCGEGKGLYRKVKNTNPSKIIVVTIKTDVSPDPNNWYPNQRDFILKPGETRILGCSVINDEKGQLVGRTSHVVLSAKFQ
jgi:hypothetical protein